MKIIINWLLFISMIAVNAMANILPINGYNTGQVSAFYPNAFVPAGFTFSIWGIIYLMLLNYTIAYTYYKLKPAQFEQVNKYLDRINNFYLGTCILNMAWIIAWHYLQIEISFLIMLLFLYSLIQLFLKSLSLSPALNKTQRFLLLSPFLVYLGWISVATIANATALLVAYNWSAFGIGVAYWSAFMILIAAVLGLVFLKKYNSYEYPMVIAWALWGIHSSQGPIYPFVDSVATVGSFYLLILALILVYKDLKNKIV